VTALKDIVERLSRVSVEQAFDPFTLLVWPEQLDREQWFTSPRFISLYGTDVYEEMSEAERRRLSFFEAVNFYSLNIHGERMLIQGLCQRLYQSGNEIISPYLHHFLAEENKHMFYFGNFCARYAGKIYPEKKMTFEREYAPGEEDFLFFAKVVIFEEIVDVHNREMSRDDRLVPISQQINFLHHFEEKRHLSFGRKLLRDLLARYRDAWSSETLTRVRQYLAEYFQATWKEYYNPEVYRDAGLPDAFALRRRALDHPRCRQHRQSVSAGCLAFFRNAGILENEVTL
jgi:hypothetical protein